MANLYELTGEWIQLMDKLEAGEDVELEFNETDEAFEEKAEKKAESDAKQIIEKLTSVGAKIEIVD